MTGTPTYNEADRQELRKFGLVFATGIVLIFGLLLPWLFEHPWPTWPWIAAGGLAATGLLLPSLLRPVFWLWMKFGHVLGWINTRIILG
ncbi:MAG: SxtJ family membrane protein, partial [Gammaproteobacteria bacterium]